MLLLAASFVFTRLVNFKEKTSTGEKLSEAELFRAFTDYQLRIRSLRENVASLVDKPGGRAHAAGGLKRLHILFDEWTAVHGLLSRSEVFGHGPDLTELTVSFSFAVADKEECYHLWRTMMQVSTESWDWECKCLIKIQWSFDCPPDDVEPGVEFIADETMSILTGCTSSTVQSRTLTNMHHRGRG